MMAEKIGLVTVTFNSGNVIDAFIKSINSQDYPDYCLYVIDNNSNDQTLKIIEEKSNSEKTIIIKNNFNNGVAGGNNQGIKKAIADGCEYILLINNDTEFEPSLFTKLIQKSKSTGYKLIVPKMMYYDSPDTIWFGGGYFNKRMGYMNYHAGQYETDSGQYPDREITYAPTCCTLISKSVFEQVGLMDEKYFVYFDDTDFMFRVMMDGTYKMLYISDVEFYHKVGSLTKSKIGTKSKFKFGDFIIKYSTRNRVYYLKKQKSLLAFSNIIWFWLKINLKFFVSGNYDMTFKKWKLIQLSFFEGLML
jgi:GT2 family glycosyltransferase